MNRSIALVIWESKADVKGHRYPGTDSKAKRQIYSQTRVLVVACHVTTAGVRDNFEKDNTICVMNFFRMKGPH